MSEKNRWKSLYEYKVKVQKKSRSQAFSEINKMMKGKRALYDVGRRNYEENERYRRFKRGYHQQRLRRLYSPIQYFRASRRKKVNLLFRGVR